ncbi:MAG: GDSL-type esterase/lipase family protein [Candidatus Aenigmatarchaeota archaeon]
MAQILVFGDSTASDEVYLGFDCWVTRLRKFVNEKEETSIFNLGIVGDTTKDLLKRLDCECKAREPDIIIIRIGGNDSRFNNKTEDSVETPAKEFEKNIHKIIRVCKKYTEKIIFVGEMPANESRTMPTIWSNTEYFTNKSIRKYDGIIKYVCKKENVPFLELFDDWLKIDYKKLLDKKDGLHPNSEGHKIIFETVKDFLLKEKII